MQIRDVYPGSRILIFTHPGSRIPDPKTATKERGEKKLDVKPFYVATKFNKIVNYFSFEVPKKKIWANFQRILELFTKKIVKKLFKIWFWDPGSGKNSFRIPDPAVKKALDPDPQYWSEAWIHGSGSTPKCHGSATLVITITHRVR